MGPSLEWNTAKNGWLLQGSQYLLLALLAGCGIRFIKVKRRLLGEATFSTLKSIWTRFTRRSASAVLGQSSQVASGELLCTQVTPIGIYTRALPAVAPMG